jgi:NADH-quinone oxidoreductase subunit L
MRTFPLIWIPLLPLLGAAVNLILGRWLGRRLSGLVGSATVGASFVLSVAAVTGPLYDSWKAARLAGGKVQPIVHHVYSWIESGPLRIGLNLLLDPLSAVMILTVTFVGFLIHIYSIGYMAHDRRVPTYFGYLNLFTGSMLILVLGDSLPVMFIGWEGVGACSYLLIGFWYDKQANASAGRKAFIVNRIGDFAFLLGIFLLWSATRQVDFAGIAAAGPRLSDPAALQGGMGLPLAFWAGLLLFIGACGKSAQIPLYTWLPDAMAGPTPVSALIHAATMVTAGVYMVARLSFLYLAAPQVLMIVAGVGALTALFAAIIGFAQTDIKRVLAYSTVSQLGFMFVGVGTGAFTAGIFHLFTHAFFKAGLFLGAGSVMHAMGDRTDIMGMGGLRRRTPITHAVFLIYCLAIAGIPPFAGFFSKDEILLGAWTVHLEGWPVWYGKLLWAILSVAALGTAFYMWRLYFLVFAGESRADEETRHHIHESPAVMTVPLIVLAIGATILGFLGPPHVFGMPSFLAQWFGAGTFPEHGHAPDGLTWALMIVATIAGAVGIAAAYALYRNGPEGAAGIVRGLGPLHRVVRNKFYVDELYDTIIVRPFGWLARATWNLVDRFLIDLVLVNGAGFVVTTVGRVTRVWQNGDVQRYLLAMLIGLAAILWLATRGDASFTVAEEAGLTLRFQADVGDGVDKAAARVEWDFDGDGTIDSTDVETSYTFPAPGSYPVVLRITGAFGTPREVKREVAVGRREP